MRVAVDGRVLGRHFPGIGRHLHGLAGVLPVVAGESELLLVVDEPAARERWGTSQFSGFHSLPAPSLGNHLPRPPYRLARDHAFDLFHATHFASASPRLGCRQVVSIYDLVPHRLPETLPSPLHRLAYRHLLRRAVRSADHLITLTEAAKRELVEYLGCNTDRITVTSSAVDPALVPPTREETERGRRNHDLGDRYVLHLSSPRPHKNRDLLLEAWRRLAPQHPSVELVLVVSDPGDKPDGAPASRETPRIHWLEHVSDDDLSALYGGAEIYVHPSRAEGFGLPVLEAMACGTPVCCSEIPSLVEITGDAARRFDPLRVDDLARSLARLLDSRREREVLARRGLAKAKQFTWTSVAEKTWSAYARALEREPERSS